tara:strand:+ start:211 stop:600 length:390 start_codon:yes stop_codon:yes gene_type:complete
MELKQKYIRDSGYDLDDDFTNCLHDIHPVLAYKIGKYIEDNVRVVPDNPLHSHVLGGVVIYNGKPVTFALDLVKQKGLLVSLTNLIFITMDEYLDLINLNCYIKTNENNSKSTGHNKRSIVFAQHKIQQ